MFCVRTISRHREIAVPALVHCQLPILRALAAQNVEVAVVPSDLEVTIICAMPLIDILGDLDPTAAEITAPKLFDSVFKIAFRSDLH